MTHYGECEWVTGVVLYEHKGKGNRNRTKKRNQRFVEGNFGSLDPTREEKKKKRFPPKFVAVKKETNENKELKDKNKHEAIGSIKKKKDMKPQDGKEI